MVILLSAWAVWHTHQFPPPSRPPRRTGPVLRYATNMWRTPAVELKTTTDGSSSSVVPFATTIGNGTFVLVTSTLTSMKSELGPAGFGSRFEVPWRLNWYKPGATPAATWNDARSYSRPASRSLQ